MSFFVGYWHKRKTKKMKEKTGEEVGPVQTKSSSLEGSFDDAFKKSIEALKVINAQVKVSDLEQGAIDATTRISWKSFGENLKVHLETNEEGKVNVAITSKPKWPLTLVDYGKGKQNVNSFTEALRSQRQ